MTNVQCESAKMIYELKGDERLPIRNVSMKNVHVTSVSDSINKVVYAENIVAENVTFDHIENEQLDELNRFESNK